MGLVIILSMLVVYHRTLDYPFHFDGEAQIVDSPLLDNLAWQDFPVKTRNLVEVTWKINRVIGGSDPFTYHLVNIAVHLTTALLLMGLIYLTLRLPGIPEVYQHNSALLAGLIAMIWAVHPLATQAVTYIIQRYESMMGMFFVLAIFCLAASATSARKWPWYVGCVVATYLSALSKEVAVVIPLVLLWYDRALLSSSWKELFANRWPLYVGAMSSWIVFFNLTDRPKAEFEQSNVVYVTEKTLTDGQVQTHVVSSWEYLLSQSQALVLYLRLSIFPIGQSLDHGWHAARSLGEVIVPATIVLLLLGITIWSIFRFPRWSFLGGCFFLTLAPTSSLLPIRDIAVEHRMYVPLAAVMALLVLLVFEGLRRFNPAKGFALIGTIYVIVGLVTIFGAVAILRNDVYQSKLSLWTDVANKNPQSPRGHYGMARAYLENDDPGAATTALQKTIEADPTYAEAYVSLGRLVRRYDPNEALQLFSRAVQVQPDYSEAHNNLGAMLAHTNPQEALKQYQLALELKPDNADAHNNLANLLANQGRFQEAIREYELALSIRPNFQLAAKNLKVVQQMAQEAAASPGSTM